ncbi:Putative Sir2-like transcriptional silencer protein (fragment) [Bradyrhizobium vignae]|uniref:Sir2-like transcriptional silencer protein n=1 Tax=Bradyrhizobium vignae TaxID=1549949 RepID=A0A2U3Q4D1_9BRAD
MSDPNIRLLLHRIWQIWDESGHSQERRKSFVFVAQRNPVQEAVLANRGITTIAPPDGMAADDGLTQLPRDIRRRLDRPMESSSRPGH